MMRVLKPLNCYTDKVLWKEEWSKRVLVEDKNLACIFSHTWQNYFEWKQKINEDSLSKLQLSLTLTTIESSLLTYPLPYIIDLIMREATMVMMMFLCRRNEGSDD